MENKLMTIKDVALYLQLTEQTIQRYVLKREIPFHKVKKVIRFRLSEVDRWVESNGKDKRINGPEELQGNLFTGLKTEDAGAAGEDTENSGGEA